VIKNFKFPSKSQIENLKISHAHPEWDDDDTQEPDHYEYSEDNTDWGDDVDPEWWNVVWNKSDDDRAGMGNGQGWDDNDPSAVESWQYEETWTEDLKEDKGSQGDCSPDVRRDLLENVHEPTIRQDRMNHRPFMEAVITSSMERDKNPRLENGCDDSQRLELANKDLLEVGRSEIMQGICG